MLMDLGVKVIFRETFLSSLDLARQTLVELGYDPARAERSVRTFRDYDEKLLKRQQAFYHDEESLIASNKEAMKDLEELFDSDEKALRKQMAEAEGEL